MIKPRNLDKHNELLTAEMVQEKAWLSKNFPIKNLGEVATDEYTARAKAFNAKCDAIGATLCKFIEA